eukprot:scaffold43499_cov72-Phaeocystis_antarctica.AAC.2
MKRGGKNILLGNFATAEEAALCYARTPDTKAHHAHRRRLLAFGPWTTPENALHAADHAEACMTAEDALRAADAEELGQSSRPVER